MSAQDTAHHLYKTHEEVEGIWESFSWQRWAACKEFPAVLFFPPGNSHLTRMDEARAKVVCSSCVVRARCLAFAMEHDEAHGIWGGLTAEERRGVRGDRRPTPRDAQR